MSQTIKPDADLSHDAATDPIAKFLTSGGTQKAQIGADGGLAVGTTAPDSGSLIHVLGSGVIKPKFKSSDNSILLNIDSGSAYGQAGVQLLDRGTQKWEFRNTADNSNKLLFYDANSLLVLSLLQGGKIGMGGTDSPGSQLEIKGAGTSSASGLNITDSAGTSLFKTFDDGQITLGSSTVLNAWLGIKKDPDTYPYLRLTNTDTGYSWTLGAGIGEDDLQFVYAGAVSHSLLHLGYDSTNTNRIVRVGQNVNDQTSYHETLGVGQNVTYLGTSENRKGILLRIDKGTADFAELVAVARKNTGTDGIITGAIQFIRAGGTDNTGSMYLKIGTGTTMDASTAMTLRYYNSNICAGIGTISPVERLQVDGNLKIGDGYYLRLPSSSGAPAGTPAAGDMYFDTSGSTGEKLRIYDGGWRKVTTTPVV